jgi:hypothetical protein
VSKEGKLPATGPGPPMLPRRLRALALAPANWRRTRSCSRS